jgi:hypothetical protein
LGGLNSANLSTHTAQDGFCIVEYSRVACHDRQAVLAEACRLKLHLSEMTCHRKWNADGIAPTKAFVKTAVCDATIIRFTANWTPPIVGQRNVHHASEPPV